MKDLFLRVVETIYFFFIERSSDRNLEEENFYINEKTIF